MDDSITKLKAELDKTITCADQLLKAGRTGLINKKDVEAFILAWAALTSRLNTLDADLEVRLPADTYPSKDDSIN